MRYSTMILVSFAAVLGAGVAIAQPYPGFDLASLDRKVDPCVDFYKFSCGGWQQANPLPGDQARYGRFDALHLAAAEEARCDWLLTTDDRFLRKAARGTGQPSVRVRNPLDYLKAVGP